MIEDVVLTSGEIHPASGLSSDFGRVGFSGRMNSATARARVGIWAKTVTSFTFRFPTGNFTLPFLATKAARGIETVLPGGMPAGSEA